MEISRCSVWVQAKVLGGARRAIEYSDKGHVRYYSKRHDYGGCGLKKKIEYDYDDCGLKMEKKKKKKKKIEDVEEGVLRRKHKTLLEQQKRNNRMMVEDSSSSSSSSSSSDSDCETRRAIGDESALLRMPLLQELKSEELASPSSMALKSEELASSSSMASSLVVVCMGPKCKKMGAESLLAELQQSTATVALPCKCMGKCKSAPNIKRFHGDSLSSL